MVAVVSIVCLITQDNHAADAVFAVDLSGFETTAKTFLTTNCLKCHGPELAEGDFRIDESLGLEFNKAAVSAKWREVVNMLNSHEMPPKDEPQPLPERVASFVDWVRKEQMRAEEFDRKSEIILRRLNRNEYRNTIRDLIGIDFDISHFPQDPPAAGFDNNGRALSSSPLQLELYLAAASTILDEALVTGAQPESISWRFEPETGDSDSNRVRYGQHNAIVNGGKNKLDGNTRVMHHNSWDRTINARDFAVPTNGMYTVRIRAASRVPTREEVVAFADPAIRAMREKEISEHPQRRGWIEAHIDEEINHFRESPIYDYGPARLKVTVHLNGQPQIIGEFDVNTTVDAMKVFELPVKMTDAKAGITLEYAYHVPRQLENNSFDRDEFPRPEVIVDWFEIEGPVYDAWPPQSYQRLLKAPIPADKPERRKLARSTLASFMPRAYRRPVSNAEIEDKLKLFDAAAADEMTDDAFLAQLKIPLTAVLVSPNFLYLAEPFRTGVDDALTPFEIASRLSYFLWSSMPDDTLFLAASKGDLRDPKQLIAQVDRMLADKKIAAVGENFAGQWLGLRDVGANPPVEELYSHYDNHVETSFVRQSVALFDDILKNDRNLTEFIDSDHEMLNEVLSRYYGLPQVKGDEMRRVKLSPDSHRGGVLTHGSVLTITSNGTRTSPVKRGTWIMKNILGTDPGLPVANAGDIAPKVPGIDKATVRQRLEIHRELAQCARCHRKIDPLGFALDNFDAAGRYRTQEGFGYQGRVQKDDPVVDASGELPDGTKINGIEDLKASLLKNQAMFVRCITEKMFTYALGREMMIADSEIIDATVARLTSVGPQSKPQSLRLLIHEITLSPTFAKR